jgi:hypothetical protein
MRDQHVFRNVNNALNSFGKISESDIIITRAKSGRISKIMVQMSTQMSIQMSTQMSTNVMVFQ